MYMHIVVVDQIRLDNRKTIRLVKGDITERYVEVIINAANSYLKHGGGVAAAIVRKGGDVIQQDSNKIGFLPVGCYNFCRKVAMQGCDTCCWPKNGRRR